jgi:hypothetical protein
MLYILRFTNGDCVVAMAADETTARQAARDLLVDQSAEVVTARRLRKFAVRLTPTDDGSLELAQWEDATLDDILAAEYPQLEQAYRRANAQPLVKTSDSKGPGLSQLKAAYDRNREIIREGLELERNKFAREQKTSSGTQKAKSARARA